MRRDLAPTIATTLIAIIAVCSSAAAAEPWETRSATDPNREGVRTTSNLRTGTTECSNNSWSTVQLDVSYTSMVVIASAHYPAGDTPAVVRIRNASGSSFDVMVQVPCGGPTLNGVTVNYMVIEEGVFTTAANGVKAESFKVNTTLTDYPGSWIGGGVSYSNAYSAPVVLGQVMSNNDSDWSQYWCYDGSSPSNPPTSSGTAIGKHIGEDPDTSRLDETVGYLVIESGSGRFGGMDYIAAVGPDIVRGPDDGTPVQYAFSPTFNTLASVVVSQAGMDGNEGGWAVVTSKSTTGFSMVIEEDQCADLERSHTTEQVGFIAFGEIWAATGPNLRTGTVNCTSDSWSTVTLDRAYNSMVVVGSARYPAGGTPAVVRIRNASGDSFDVLVQNPCAGLTLSDVAVDYLVIEEGVYTELGDGIDAEAFKIYSSTTDHSGSWIGTGGVFSGSYEAPVVLGQIMSTDDADWSQFWCYDGNSVTNPPSSAGLAVGKHVGEDPNFTRLDETLGYLVIESGTGTVEGLGYEAGVGPDIVMGPDDGTPIRYHPSTNFDPVQTLIVGQAGMDDADGGWAIATSLDANGIDLVIEEDQCSDSERSHGTEQVAYLIFGDPSSMFLIFADGFETGDTSHWADG